MKLLSKSAAPGRALALVAIGLALGGSAWAQTRYTVTDLGMLPGYAACVTTSLNDTGQVAGYCAPPVENFNQMGFVWRNGVMSPVGKLKKGLYSTVNSINASGAMAGDGDTGNIRPQGWTSNGGALVNFFPNNGGNTHALFIADQGWIGGYYTKSLSGNTASWRSAIWSVDPKDPRKYVTTNLPVLPGGVDPAGTTSLSLGFNQAGQAVGYAMNDQIGQHAAFWNNDSRHSIVDLGVFDQDNSSLANAINDHGQIVGSSHPPFGSRAVMWSSAPEHTPSELPLLPGDNNGMAHVINNQGQVLGASYYSPPGSWDVVGSQHLVIWRDGGVFDLQSLLEPISGAGWTLLSTAALNQVGQIAATASRNGQQRAVLLTPIN